MATKLLASSGGDLFFWDVEAERWVHMPTTGISSIVWDEEQTFICRYCKGTVNKNGACSGCGARDSVVHNSLGKARIAFNFFLPELAMFEPPEYIRATFSQCGQRCNPENWILKMEFRVLRVCRRYIDTPISIAPDSVCRLEMFVEAECDVTLETRSKDLDENEGLHT